MSRQDAEALVRGFDKFRENPDWHRIMSETGAGDVYHACKDALREIDHARIKAEDD